ncbi:MAG: hypothetical protein HYV07_02715 [Deltaproteobacteria bacterium]|nr:hypothetical protein [Deltaproteobacteria bacterium]
MAYSDTQHLDRLADELIHGVLVEALGIREGIVMTEGPPPYRRLDCDGRALAYVRSRPKKDVVRVDISGLWAAPPPSPLQISTATGTALLLRDRFDVRLAIELIAESVLTTRERNVRSRSMSQAA